MQVHQVTWRHRNDYSAIMGCEHCGHQQHHGGLYADAYFAFCIIPNRYYCDKCDLNSLGEKRPESDRTMTGELQAKSLKSVHDPPKDSRE